MYSSIWKTLMVIVYITSWCCHAGNENGLARRSAQCPEWFANLDTSSYKLTFVTTLQGHTFRDSFMRALTRLFWSPCWKITYKPEWAILTVRDNCSMWRFDPSQTVSRYPIGTVPEMLPLNCLLLPPPPTVSSFPSSHSFSSQGLSPPTLPVSLREHAPRMCAMPASS